MPDEDEAAEAAAALQGLGGLGSGQPGKVASPEAAEEAPGATRTSAGSYKADKMSGGATPTDVTRGRCACVRARLLMHG